MSLKIWSLSEKKKNLKNFLAQKENYKSLMVRCKQDNTGNKI